MMSSFDSAFRHTVGIEGGYSNHAADRGGETKYGITARVARANGYGGPLRDLPLETARAIYKTQYWDTLNLDAVSELSEMIAGEMFDTSVNMGVGVAARFLQRALNVSNRDGKDFPDMDVDGVIGPVTVAALDEYLERRGAQGELVLIRLLDGLQAVRYIEIAERDPSQEAFIFGWILNRVNNHG